MKKLLPILLTLCMVFGALAGCSDPKPNTAPLISGVNAASNVTVGTEFNALSGVTAEDAEDGDITSKIVVTAIPALTFTSGKATPSATGTYELTYSVKDAGGEEAKEYSTLTVIPAVAAEEEYKNFEFKDAAEVNLNGWGVMAEETVATGGVENGMYVVDVKNIGTDANQLKFAKTDFNVVAGTKYELKFYMKTTAATDKLTHVLFEDAKDPAWAPEAGSDWNLPISNTWKTYTYSFKASTTSDEFNIIFEFGKILDEAADFAPFKLMIQKIEIFSGEISGTSIYKDDYSKGISAVSLAAAAEVATLAAVAGKPEINVLANPANPWELIVRHLSTATLAKDVEYKAVIKLNSTAAFNYQMCIEDAAKAHEQRALFTAGTVDGEKIIDVVFKSICDLENASFVFYLGGNAALGKITILEVDLLEIDKSVSLSKEIQKFHPNSKETEFDCFNGTDEGQDSGIGTMYMKDGKMFYAMTQVGGTEWFNKIFTNVTKLDGGAMFRFEITVKANVESKCWFLLNKKGGWDPRVNEYFTIGTTAQKFTFELSGATVTATDYEMVFSFGYPENKDKGDITVEFSEIKIIKLAIAS